MLAYIRTYIPVYRYWRKLVLPLGGTTYLRLIDTYIHACIHTDVHTYVRTYTYIYRHTSSGGLVSYIHCPFIAYPWCATGSSKCLLSCSAGCAVPCRRGPASIAPQSRGSWLRERGFCAGSCLLGLPTFLTNCSPKEPAEACSEFTTAP